MRVEDYQKYMDVLHELAKVEDDLRTAVENGSSQLSSMRGYHQAELASRILFERFGA